MNWLSFFGVSIVVLLIILYEWPKMEENQVKEKRLFIVLVFGTWVIAGMLIFFPDLPGPIDLITYLFSPMEDIIE
ncbi:hypothetical protein [Thalassobacillus devorans]|uniref:hypothetical protein n=1 Tax=Thalassobacillus devorans TaxID=279813 RepID=UPI00048FBB2A|nr:hypothetical protein [Thalassobacillus devorans]